MLCTWTVFMVFLCGILTVHVVASDLKAPAFMKIATLDFKPRSYFEDGKFKGYHLDLQSMLMKEAGIDYSLTIMPTSRMYHELQAGRKTVDAWLSIEVDSVVAVGIPVKPSIFSPLRLEFFGKAGSIPPKITEFKDERLITIIGYKYDGVVDKLKRRLPGLRILEAPSHEVAFRMLKAGRANYVIDYRSPALAAVAELGIEEVSNTLIYRQMTLLFVSRNNPDAKQLVARLSAASKLLIDRWKTEGKPPHLSGGISR